MLKIESNLKINGRHWGLAFVDGVAYTTNASLAAKLRQKGYVVTDVQPEQTVAGSIDTKHEHSTIPASPAQVDTVQGIKQSEQSESILSDSVSISSSSVSILTEETTKKKPTKPRKRVVTADAIDAG